ncbi:hypothetical protein M4951_19675 [Blastopirellula sp. J2-11]|uniref:DUF6580 family putative transport protein n=1 Tax=Blastopirellula sp. J2-11 TaxID=2943192 RepID=UPI0021C9F1EA|nr:DUF6580 family putative transport protein [Blastopirellula sp. J2-11]UUO05584.1 hypothetical protein M4951_19675 [Blastopirellula sp. J2-11]
MKKETVERLLLVLSLISIGVALRWMLCSYPNVAPTAALAMFAGYKLSSVRWALMVPIWITTLSDVLIGGYAWPVMLTVYVALALPVFLGVAVRRFQPKMDSWLGKLTSGLLLGGASVCGSVLFFVISNFAVWASTAAGFGLPMYDASWSGLVECYAAALPFFRYTLTGDACFNGAIFGAYALGCLLVASPQKEKAAAARMSNV